jgi:ElaB/YqjD/DUF883 family membrane-anchored ribosome-binding protein
MTALETKAEKASASREELRVLREDIERLRTDLKDLLKAAREDSTGKLEDIRQRIAQTAKDLEERAGSGMRGAYGNVRERGQTALRRGREQVQERPLTVVLGAFVVGLLLGKLLDRS